MEKIRCSSLSNYFDCPRRTFARSGIVDIDKESLGMNPHPGNTIGAAIGTGVHTAAFNLNQGIIKSTRGAIETAVESYRGEIENGVIWDAVTRTDNHATKQVNNIVKAYHKMVFPKIRPIQSEVRLTAKYKGIILTGQPDVVEVSSIRDLKTSSQLGQYIAQLGGYGLLAEANKIKTSGNMVIDHIQRMPVSKPAAKPTIKKYEKIYAKKLAKITIKSIVETLKNYKSKGNDPDVIPANPDSKLCSPKYCPAYGSIFCEVSKHK